MSGGTVTSDESLGEPQRRATRFPRGASTRIADPAACPRGERAGAPVPRFHSWSATDQPRGVGPRGESDDREMDWLPWPPVWTWDITPSSRSRRQPANCVRRRKDSCGGSKRRRRLGMRPGRRRSAIVRQTTVAFQRITAHSRSPMYPTCNTRGIIRFGVRRGGVEADRSQFRGFPPPEHHDSHRRRRCTARFVPVIIPIN
jgi:hypothetical protein